RRPRYGSTPTRRKSHRAITATPMPIAAQSIHDGKNEPMTLICGPTVFPLSVRRVGVRDLARCEREGRRRLQQLNLRVELHESRTTQLTPGGEQVGQRAEPHTVRLQRVLVRLLRGIQQRGC